jgi:hypothetical protein
MHFSGMETRIQKSFRRQAKKYTKYRLKILFNVKVYVSLPMKLSGELPLRIQSRKRRFIYPKNRAISSVSVPG